MQKGIRRCMCMTVITFVICTAIDVDVLAVTDGQKVSALITGLTEEDALTTSGKDEYQHEISDS